MNTAIFLSGITMATFAASGLFFFKFWKSSHNRFFLLFGVACGLISIERVVALFVQGTQESIRSTLVEASAWVYLIRLSAFIFILLAIIDRNREAP
jgi:hypothetical protein